MHNELVDVAIVPGIGYEREIKTPKQLNWKLRDLIPNLRNVEVQETKDKRGTALFTFVDLSED